MCEGPDVVVDDTPTSILIPETEERHYHSQCVPLNLARTEHNYTPGQVSGYKSGNVVITESRQNVG